MSRIVGAVALAVLCLNPGLGLGQGQAQAPGVSGKRWIQLKGDARRSGNAPEEDVSDSLGLLAAVPMTDAILSSPVVADGRVYVVDAAGVAAAIDTTTLKPVWKFESRGGAPNCNNVSSPALLGKYLHFGTMAGSWVVLDAADGTLVRELRVGEPVFSSPVVANGRVYFSTLGSRVYALTPEGSVLWTWDYVKDELRFPGDRWSGESWLSYRNAKLRQGDQFLCARDLAASKHLVVPAGGSLVWLEDLGDHAQAHDVHGRSAPTFGVTIGDDGSVYRQWSYLDNEGQVERVGVWGTELYTGPGDGMGTIPGTESGWFGPGLASLSSFSSVSLRGTEVFRTRPQDGYGLCRHRPGRKEAERLCAPAAIASPVILKTSVVYGDLEGSLHVVPLEGARTAWSFQTASGKAIPAPVAVAEGRIYFGCEDGYLYILGPGGRASPSLPELDLWKRRSPRPVTGPERFTSFGQFDNANASNDGLKPPFRLKWVRRFEGTVKHLSTFGGGRQYTHTAEGQIFAVEEETGRLLWRVFYPGVHLSYTSALYHHERLLVPQAGPDSCRLRCLDAATGKLLWEAPFEGTPGWTRESPPVVHGALAFYTFATGKRSVAAGQNWLPGHGPRSFPSSQRPMLRAYEVETGKTAWERDFSELGSGGDESGICLMDGKLYYSCFFGTSPERDGKPSAQGITAALEPSSGKVIWQTTDYSVRGGVAPSARDGRLYVSGQSAVGAGGGRHVWCLDARDGSLVWKSDPLLGVLQVTTVGSGFLFVHAQYQEGYLLDKATGRVLTVIKHPYKCTRFTLSEPYLLGPNLDVLDLADPKNPRLVATGPRLDPTECVASVVSNGRLFYTALAGGLQVSEVFGREAELFVPPWSDR
jgi:outer membrane protein assembly factor BamB